MLLPGHKTMNHNLYLLFEKNFSSHLSKIFLITLCRKKFTYQDLITKSANYANLLNQLGLKKGDRIIVQVEKSPECLFLYLGCLRAGVIYIPLNPTYPLAEKDLIITGGLNVYPKEIELYINQLTGIIESAVIGIPHPDLGEAVIAVISKQNPVHLKESELVELIKQKIAPFKVPKKIFFVEQLPKNAMGKIQKNILRDQYKTAKI